MNKQTFIDVATFVDTPNANNVVYDRNAMETAIEKYKKKIDSGLAVGEFSNNGYCNGRSEIDINNISHKILKLEIRGNEVMATGQFLTPPPEEFLNGELTFGMRAMGIVDNSGVTHDIEIISIDLLNRKLTNHKL